MSIKLWGGSLKVKDIQVGNKAIKEVYNGDDLVYNNKIIYLIKDNEIVNKKLDDYLIFNYTKKDNIFNHTSQSSGLGIILCGLDIRSETLNNFYVYVKGNIHYKYTLSATGFQTSWNGSAEVNNITTDRMSGYIYGSSWDINLPDFVMANSFNEPRYGFHIGTIGIGLGWPNSYGNKTVTFYSELNNFNLYLLKKD